MRFCVVPYHTIPHHTIPYHCRFYVYLKRWERGIYTGDPRAPSADIQLFGFNHMRQQVVMFDHPDKIEFNKLLIAQ